jgi:trans-2,3-dihydro-3-hydroxyanthranilic acid synthase
VGIPAIVPYPMPVESELPPNVMSWRPDPARAVLLVHDMQRYFLGFFPQGESPVVDLVDNTARVVEAARALRMPIVYTAQPGGMTREQRGLLLDVWGPGMDTEPRKREIVPEVAPRDGDVVLTKWRYSAFARSDLRRRMRDWGRDQLVVCGVYAHVGILATATDAFTDDIQPFLVADAIADFTIDYHRLALSYAGERCAQTVTTDMLLDALSQPLAAAG